MIVTTQQFYKEVVGCPTVSTPTALTALDRWNIPYFTNTPMSAGKRYWKVDTQHMPAAKAAYEAEIEARRLRLEKKKAPKAKDEPHSAMERLGAVEERLLGVEEQLKALNEQLSAFIKKF